MAFASMTINEDFNPGREQDNPNLEFAKRDGGVETAGHFYEIYLCMLMLLKKEEVNVEEMYLASNITTGANLDDVALKVIYEDSYKIRRCRIFFVQAKHIKNLVRAPKVGFDLLLSESKNFSLKTYFKSYKIIKRYFEENTSADPILNSDFEDCEFVLYTTLLPSNKFNEQNGNVRKVAIGCDHFLNFQEENYYYQICLEGSDKISQKIRSVLKSHPDIDDTELLEFLDKFKLFIKQPNKDQLHAIISKKLESIYKIKPNNIAGVFSNIQDTVVGWWEKGDYYLTKNNTYFEDFATITIFNVKAPVDPFMGRKRELSELHKNFQTNALTTSICGLGGIGKTELARKYAHVYGKYYDNNVMWIKADDEDTLKDSFVTLAKDQLQITTDCNGEDKTLKSIVEEIYNFFSKRNRKCLFIFDNADEYEGLHSFLPHNLLKPNDKKPFILITSRNHEWETRTRSLHLDVWELEEAEEFLKKTLNIIDGHQDEAIKQLVVKLQQFPLALEQAAAYIHTEKILHNSTYTINDYLKQYHDETEKLLDYDGFQGIINQYTKTNLTTWKITIDKIVSDEELGMLTLKIFNMIAYCAPDDIKVNMFLKLANHNEIQLKSVINLMAKYSLIKLHNEVFSVHRLVQEVTRLKLRNNQSEMTVLRKLLNLLEHNVSYDIVTHAISVWNYSNKFNKLTTDYFTLWANVSFLLNLIDPKLGASLASTLNNRIENDNLTVEFKVKSQCLIAETLLWWNQREAKLFCNYILEKFEDELGSTHSNVLEVRYILAFCLIDQGLYEDAMKIYRNIFEREIKLLGKHEATEDQESCDEIIRTSHHSSSFDEDTTKQQYIAYLLLKQDKHRKAVEVLKHVLEQQTVLLTAEHRETLLTQYNIANILSEQGKFENAIDMFNIILEKQIEMLGRDHEDTLRTLNNVVWLLLKHNKREKASQLLKYHRIRLNYEKQVKILGVEHFQSLLTQQLMAYSLMEKEKFDEASSMFNELLEIQTRVVGKNHHDTLKTEHGIAKLLVKQGRYEEALELFGNVLERQTEFLGEKHPETIFTKCNMARLIAAKPINWKGSWEFVMKILKNW